MTEKIELKIEYSADDYTRQIDFIQSKSFFYKHNYIFVGIFAIIGLIAFNLLKNKDENGWHFPNVITLIIGISIIISIVYALKGYKLSAKNSAAKHYQSSSVLQETQIISFDEDGVKSKSESSEGKLDWNTFIEAAETEKDFFFLVSSQTTMSFPKRAFESNIQQNQLRELAKRKLGDKANSLQKN